MAVVPLWQPGTLYQPGDLVRPTSSSVITQPALDNPDFEGGDNGWTDTGFGSWTIDTDPPFFDGTWSGKAGFTDNPNGTQLKVVDDAVLPCVPGQIVTAHCFVFGPTASGDPSRVQFRIQWYNSGMAPLAPSDLALDPTDLAGEPRIDANGLAQYACREIWLPLENTGVAPAGAAFFEIQWIFSWGDMPFAVDTVTLDYTDQTPPNFLLFRAVQATAGFSANVEPTWPTTIGLTVVDNEVTWEAVSGNSVTWEAQRILVSGAVEPVWPLTAAGSVADNTISWALNSRRITDSHVPNDSAIVTTAASKVFIGDGDIMLYSATVNPLDFTTRDDAGYIPFGLQQYGSNPIAAVGIYRGNLAIFNSEGCQLWQVDEDPAAITYLDAIPTPCTYPKSVQPVGDDLAFLSNLGIRSLGLSGASINLQGGYFGQQIDPLVVPAIAEALAEGWTPRGLYWPARGQYWLFFGAQAFVLTITAITSEKKMRSWSRYIFPWVVDDWTLQGTDLVLRAGNLVEIITPDVFQDDVHDVTSAVQIDLDVAIQYATAGWAAGVTSVALGTVHNHVNTTPVHLVGQVLGLPVLYVCAQSVGAGTTDQAIVASFDNGVTWAGQTTPVNTTAKAMAQSMTRGGEILALATNGAILRSLDGITWSVLANDIGNLGWSDLVRHEGLGLYIACGGAGALKTSPDGVTWTLRTTPNANGYVCLFIANDGGILSGTSANVLQPVMRSTDGINWALLPSFGTATDVSRIVQSTSGRYMMTTLNNLRTISSTDLIVFTQVSSTGGGHLGGGQHAIDYVPGLNLFVVGSPTAIFSMAPTDTEWTQRETGEAFRSAKDFNHMRFAAGPIGVRPASGGISTHRVLRSLNATAWTETAPAAIVQVPQRIYEFLSAAAAADGSNTPTFASRTITGVLGATSVEANLPVVAEAGNRLIIRYPGDGPFTPADGNTVGSLELAIDQQDGIQTYVKAFSVLRITHAGGEDWNYLRTDLVPGAIDLPLLFPLEHVVESFLMFPPDTRFINTADDTLGYVALNIAAGITFATTITLTEPLTAAAVGLQAIIRPYEINAVAGGQGTASVTLANATDFSNGAAFIPETGFPAAPVLIGAWLETPVGENFVGVMQWPFIDMKVPGADKELIGFDLIMDGMCEVSIGYNQRTNMDYDLAGAWTTPFAVPADTLPGDVIPYSVTGPTLSLRIEWQGGQYWHWWSSNLYIKDDTLWR